MKHKRSTFRRRPGQTTPTPVYGPYWFLGIETPISKGASTTLGAPRPEPARNRGTGLGRQIAKGEGR